MKAGDVVKLKSGGPCLSVFAVDGEKVTCVWFGNGLLHNWVFHIAQLVEATERDLLNVNYRFCLN